MSVWRVQLNPIKQQSPRLRAFSGTKKMRETPELENSSTPYQSATDLLQLACDQIGDRASERDTEAERSMSSTVNAFNALYGTNLTEEQGWMFMVFLKAARAKGGRVRVDDYVDGSAYFALAGEAAIKSR